MRDNIIMLYYVYRYLCIIVKGDEMLYNPNGRAYGINLQSIEKHLKFCNNKLQCIV